MSYEIIDRFVGERKRGKERLSRNSLPKYTQVGDVLTFEGITIEVS